MRSCGLGWSVVNAGTCLNSMLTGFQDASMLGWEPQSALAQTGRSLLSWRDYFEEMEPGQCFWFDWKWFFVGGWGIKLAQPEVI